MKILNAAQIREGDKYTIANEPISSADLMERAASACTAYITGHGSEDVQYIVICGHGNNGGDGLAIARMLSHASCTVEVYILDYTSSASPDFAGNLALLHDMPSVLVHQVAGADEIILDKKNAVIIDAILGTGINRAADGLIADVISKINKSGLPVISVDVPSGLPSDDPLPKGWLAVKASVTLTFQQPKFSFLFPEGGDHVGELKILGIGISETYIDSADTPYYFLQEADILPLLKRRERFDHKGTFGHSLLIAGSHGKMGAALLASRACLSSGTGLLTAHIPSCGYDILQTALPEAMVSTDIQTGHISALPSLTAYTSIGIGPGIGRDADTARVVGHLIQSTPCPLIIDADALNILSDNKTWLGFLPPRSILTPHPKEFDRLTEQHTGSRERLKSAQDLAHRHSIIIVLKGAYTAIVMPDRRVWFNSTGSPALARGGSGDVLTGIITGLVSRGYECSDAAFLGVYLHGLAADLAVSDIHPESLLASELTAYISPAFEYLYRGGAAAV